MVPTLVVKLPPHHFSITSSVLWNNLCTSGHLVMSVGTVFATSYELFTISVGTPATWVIDISKERFAPSYTRDMYPIFWRLQWFPVLRGAGKCLGEIQV